MGKQGFALSSSGKIYVYQELTALTSGAMGLDIDDSGKLKFHVINGTGALPDNSSQISIDPNTNIVTIPNLSANIAFNWNEITGSSATMSINQGYIANNAGLVTLTLPATAVQGSMLYITGKNTGGFTIAQNASQTIFFGTQQTTTGVMGSLSSTNRRDTIALVCITANNDWNVIYSIGNLTYV